MRTLIIAALAVAATVAPQASMAATGDTQYRHAGCHTHKCDKRVDKKLKVHRIYRFCNTWSCVKRANKAATKRLARHMRKVIAPYRGWLYSTRMCESGGDYSINTGNGFYGAYQFVKSTWQGIGGSTEYPHQAEPLEQDYRTVLLRQRDGTSPWPVCG